MTPSEKRKEKRSLGICIDCSEPAKDGYALCEAHRDRHRVLQSARTKRCKDAGLCVSCAAHPSTEGTTRCAACRSKTNVSSRKHNRQEKQTVVDAYGGACTCCGDRTFEFLTIDHINSDGAEHRRQLGNQGGKSMYVWLRENGFPKDNFQLLCFNCNCAKAFYGQCPHQVKA